MKKDCWDTVQQQRNQIHLSFMSYTTKQTLIGIPKIMVGQITLLPHVILLIYALFIPREVMTVYIIIIILGLTPKNY